MRKVSKEIAIAFINNQRESVGNTTTDGNAVFLHGHKIVERREDGIYCTLAGWGTVTTRERLNAINIYLQTGIAFAQRNHEQVLFNRNSLEYTPISTTDWVKVA